MGRESTKSSRVNLYMPDKLWGIVRKLAKRRGQTYSELVRMAVMEYIKRELETEKQVGV